MVDGTNLFAYAQGNPLLYVDPTGTQCDPTTASCIDPTVPTQREEALQQNLPEDERYLPPESNPDFSRTADSPSRTQQEEPSVPLLEYAGESQVLQTLGWGKFEARLREDIEQRYTLTDFERELIGEQRNRGIPAAVVLADQDRAIQGYWFENHPFGVPGHGGLAVSRSGEPLYAVLPLPQYREPTFAFLPIPIPLGWAGRLLGWAGRGVLRAVPFVGRLSSVALRTIIRGIEGIVGREAVRQITAGTNREMLGQAIRHVQALEGSAAQKANLFERLIPQINRLSGGSWSAVRGAGSAGSHVFLGEAGEALVIDAQGQLFRGSLQSGAIRLLGPAQFEVNFSLLRPM